MRPWWTTNERNMTRRAHKSANGHILNEPERDLGQEHLAVRDGERPHRRRPHPLRHQERLA